VHAITVVLDLMQPVPTSRRFVHEACEQRLDPLGRREALDTNPQEQIRSPPGSPSVESTTGRRVISDED
jgi:hypothetical protein